MRGLQFERGLRPSEAFSERPSARGLQRGLQREAFSEASSRAHAHHEKKIKEKKEKKSACALMLLREPSDEGGRICSRFLNKRVINLQSRLRVLFLLVVNPVAKGKMTGGDFWCTKNEGRQLENVTWNFGFTWF